jgi:GTPase SAR1 family protein
MLGAMGEERPVMTGGSDRAVYKGKVVVVGDYSSGKTSLVHRYGTGNYLGIQEPTIAAAFQTKVVDLSQAPPAPRDVTSHTEPGVVGRSLFRQGAGVTAATLPPPPGATPAQDKSRLAAARSAADQKVPRAGPVHEVRDCGVKLEIWDTAGSERYQSLMPMYFRDAAVALLVFDVTRRSTFEHITRWLEAYHLHNDRANTNTMRAIIVAAKSDLFSWSSVGDPSKEMGGPDRDLDVPGSARRPAGSDAGGYSTAAGAAAGLAPTGPSVSVSAALSRPPATGSSAELPEVTLAEVNRLGEQLGLPVCFTSAKADWNVQLLFRDVATHVAAVAIRAGGRTGGGGGAFGLRNGLSSPASMMIDDDPMRRERDTRGDRQGGSGGNGQGANGKRKCGCN